METNSFKRGLKQDVEAAAKTFFSSSIGKDIVEARYNGRPAFQICIRHNYLNVYWRGCSVLRYEPVSEKFAIHHKYVDTKKHLKSQILYVPLAFLGHDLQFDGWSFSREILDHAHSESIPCLTDYCDPKSEKSMLSAYITRENPLLMDLEVAFARRNDRPDKKRAFVADRIDMAELVISEEVPELRLVEVKLATDPRLRSETEPKIMEQMGYYREFIKSQESSILNSYRTIARNYKALGISRPGDEVLEQFTKQPKLHPEPHLLVLGTEDQLDGRKNNHWAILLELFEEKGYPVPTLHSI